MSIFKSEEYHPNYYRADRAALMQRLFQLMTIYEGATAQKGEFAKRLATVDFAILIQAEAGCLTVSDFDERDEILKKYDYIADVWEQNGSVISDAAGAIDTLVTSLPNELPQIAADVRRHVYFHLGKNPKLALNSLSGEFVGGVYVSSFQPLNGEAQIFLMAVTRRGGAIREEDILQKRYLNQSAIVISSYTGAELIERDGEFLMMGDPAVALANKIALHLYADMVARFGSVLPVGAEFFPKTGGEHQERFPPRPPFLTKDWLPE